MKAVANPVTNPSLCDTIIVKLHQAISPFAEVQSFRSTINTSGEGSFIFPAALMNGSYFISVHHRNALETWSSLPVTFTSAVTNYIFSDAVSKALGNNMRNLGDGRFALYSGDVDHNGTIQVIDMNNVQAASQINASGYIPEDLNGDGMVESTDYSLLENNMNVFRVQP